MKTLFKKLEINLIALLSILIVAISAITFASSLDLGLSPNITHEKTCRNVEQIPVGYNNMISFAFGNTSTGTTKVLTGTYANIGKGYISAVQASMSSSTGGFRLYSSTCVNATLTANQSCNYKTAFTPVAAGAVANVAFIESDQLDTVRVPVSGTGTSTVTGAWYYPGAYGETSFTAPNGWLSGYAAGSKITAGATGNVTKIGINFRVDPLASCKAALYDTATPANRLSTGATFTPAVGWNSIDIPSTAVTSGNVYAAMIDCNGAFDIYSVTVGGIGVYGNPTYAAFPTATQTLTVDTMANGVRIWIE